MFYGSNCFLMVEKVMSWRDVPCPISPSHPIGREIATENLQVGCLLCMTSPSFLIVVDSCLLVVGLFIRTCHYLHVMWVKQVHKPSPSHHHFYRWHVYHSQSWVVCSCLTHILLYASCSSWGATGHDPSRSGQGSPTPPWAGFLLNDWNGGEEL